MERTRMVGALLLLLSLVLGLGITPPSSYASGPDNGRAAAHEEDTVLVGYHTGVPESRKGDIERDEGAPRHRTVGGDTRVLKVGRGQVSAKIDSLKRRPEVRYAEPNYKVHAIAGPPNDPSYAQLWGMNNTGQTVNGTTGTAGADIKAPAAWGVTTGSNSIVVGVVDTGVYYNHPDLAANMWSNPGGKGLASANCVAGTRGYNAITNTCDPLDDNAHGTHVAGTIGATGNNSVGVVGVNWQTSIMGLKFLSASGSGYTSDAIEAIEFAIVAKQQGINVRVLNNSWGGGGFSQAMLDQINKAGANDILFVAAAGNSGLNNDSSAFYPCNYNAANLICVAATDQKDGITSFSNYGKTTVDLGAPGVNILSTVPSSGYAYYAGTSMATPHVTGAAALALSQGNLSVGALKSRIMAGVDPIPALAGKTATGGRLNLCKVITGCGSPTPTAPAAPTISATAGNHTVRISWAAPSDGGSTITSYKVYRRTGSGSQSLLTTVSGPSPATLWDDNTALNGTTYRYQVTAVNAVNEGPKSNEVSATPQGPVPPGAPRSLSASNRTSRQINLTWRAPSSTGSSAITGYRIYRGTSAGGEGSVPYATVGNVLSFRDSPLTRGTRYYYKVTAVSSAGEGPASSEVNATVR